MEIIVLTASEQEGRRWQYALEDQGEDWRCMPVLLAEQVLTGLQRWTDVLILQSCCESRTLLQVLTDAPLLSPPYILGWEMDAPDGCITEPSELTCLLSEWRTTSRLPVLSKYHLPAAERMAEALLRTMDVPRRLRAWEFLPEMIALTVVHPPLLTDLRHGLYPMIAARHGMTAAGVERRLRLCVESTWMHGSLAALERFFGSSVDPERGKPTNREFLCRVQERLALTMQRLV